jgi:hypothetical protein
MASKDYEINDSAFKSIEKAVNATEKLISNLKKIKVLSEEIAKINLANGVLNGAAGAGYIYAPQVQTSVSAEGVFDVLSRHSRQFFSIISEGVQQDPGIRNLSHLDYRSNLLSFPLWLERFRLTR